MRHCAGFWPWIRPDARHFIANRRSANENAGKHTTGHSTLDQGKSPTPAPRDDRVRIVERLEDTLLRLDRAGSHKAAAHLDAAIQQLRRDLAAADPLTPDTLAPDTLPDTAEKTAATSTIASLPGPFRDPAQVSQVFPRKAKPATAR